MQVRGPLEVQKEVLVETFNQAKAYTNVIMVAGYAGAFALWQSQSNLTPATSLAVGLLLAISISTFIGWEIFGMIQRFKSIAALRQSIEHPERFVEEISRYQANAIRQVRQVERLWHPVIFVAAGSAGLALVILVSAFCHGLLIEFHRTNRLGGGMELNALSMVLGGLLAGLVGVAALRFEGRRSAVSQRRAIAMALSSDLRSSAELYREVISTWDSEKIVLFDLLDQIEFVRASFGNDRPYLHLLNDEYTRARINRYFRTSYVALKRLRDLQEQIYGTEDIERQANFSKAIQGQVENLQESAAEAEELADQLTIHNKF